MRKRNAVSHALLNADTNTNIILIQEPWYGKIGTAREDNTRDGVDVLGGVASSAWETLYPGLKEGQRPKVMAYARKQAQDDRNATHFTVVPRLDVCTSGKLHLTYSPYVACTRSSKLCKCVRQPTCIRYVGF